jgi:hypothetical protein
MEKNDRKVTVLEVQFEHLYKKLDEINDKIDTLATKEYLASAIRQHELSCPAVKKTEFYQFFIQAMGQWIIEKEQSVNRFAGFVKNVSYLITVLATASVIMCSLYYFLIGGK